MSYIPNERPRKKGFLVHNFSRVLNLQILRPDSCSTSKNTLHTLFSAKSVTKRAKCQSFLDPYKKHILNNNPTDPRREQSAVVADEYAIFRFAIAQHFWVEDGGRS